jgi:hypothetical protein
LSHVTKPNTKNNTPMMTIEVTYWRPVCGSGLLDMAQLPLAVDSECIRKPAHLLVNVVKMPVHGDLCASLSAARVTAEQQTSNRVCNAANRRPEPAQPTL